jgi:hypothetical protein
MLMFNVLLKWCWKLSKWLLVGLAPNLIDKGVAITQYAYDTILCITHDPKKAINLKLLLYLSDLMSSLKINYQKIEIFWLEVIILLWILILPYLVIKLVIFL